MFPIEAIDSVINANSLRNPIFELARKRAEKERKRHRQCLCALIFYCMVDVLESVFVESIIHVERGPLTPSFALDFL